MQWQQQKHTEEISPPQAPEYHPIYQPTFPFAHAQLENLDSRRDSGFKNLWKLCSLLSKTFILGETTPAPNAKWDIS